MDPSAFLKAVYASMKPGARDRRHRPRREPQQRHARDGREDHRIDPKVVKADFKRAGFVFAGSSDVLRNPADDHSLLVFDPKIRGKTDRFIFKFKKPR